MVIRNSEYTAQLFHSADWCLVAALSAGHGCVASKEPWPLPKQELKQKNSSRGEQGWEGIFSHRRL